MAATWHSAPSGGRFIHLGLLLQLGLRMIGADSLDLSIDCTDPVHLLDEMGVITSSPYYPLPENTTGCRMWYMQTNPGDHIILSFDDLDLVTLDQPRCTGGQVILGPDPNRTLCGSLRHMNLSLRAYRPNGEHMLIKYYHQRDQIGRGFKLTYLKDSAFSRYCPNQYFRCSDGTCILEKWACNGAFECPDLSDEVGCAADPVVSTIVPFDCGFGYIRCEDLPYKETRCFPDTILCNGIKECYDGQDEKYCQSCMYVKDGPMGTVSSPRYPNNYPNNLDCIWSINGAPKSTIQIRFLDFAITQSDYVEIRDSNNDDNIIARFDWKNPPTRFIESSSNTVAVLFHSDNSGSAAGFNATYQEKGVCMTGQTPCRYGEHDCYDNSTERCDGTWNCPMHGGDERGCGDCGVDRFSCGSGSQCYREADHCNGIVHCSNKKDEWGCSPFVCGPHNGTFLCQNQMCIYQSWHCDGANDCGDNSDEFHCPLSRKVVIAAVIGSLICALLLTIALGCTCQLHAVRLREQQNRRRYQSPLTRLQEEIFARRLAPPNYMNAMATSRPYDEAREEFLQQMQAALATNSEVDIPSLMTRVTAPDLDSNSNQSHLTLPTISELCRVSPLRPMLNTASNLLPSSYPRPQLAERTRADRHSSGDSTSSDDTMIDIAMEPRAEPNRNEETSNVLVNISVSNEVSAHWSRNDEDNASQAAVFSMGRATTDVAKNGCVKLLQGASSDSDSELISLSGDDVTGVDCVSDAHGQTAEIIVPIAYKSNADVIRSELLRSDTADSFAVHNAQFVDGESQPYNSTDQLHYSIQSGEMEDRCITMTTSDTEPLIG